MKLAYTVIVKLYTAYQVSRNFSKHTIDVYERDIKTFFRWLTVKRNKEDIRDVTQKDILAYRLYLMEARKKGKSRYCNNTQRAMILHIQQVFHYLIRHEYLIANPFEHLDIIGQKERAARDSIPYEIICTVLDSIDGIDLLDIRDRTVCELLYGTGLRVGEVSRLDIHDVNIPEASLLVRQGKGKKDRLVPLGKNLADQLTHYVTRCRPAMLQDVQKPSVKSALFISSKGGRLQENGIALLVKRRFKEAGFEEYRVSPHILRHSFASHLLENGATIKHVKDILGHESYQTTAGYTHFTVQSLRRIMKQYHPLENELYQEEDEKLQEIEQILIEKTEEKV